MTPKQTKHPSREIPGGWAECAREEGVASRGERARTNVAVAETTTTRGEDIQRRERGGENDFLGVGGVCVGVGEAAGVGVA